MRQAFPHHGKLIESDRVHVSRPNSSEKERRAEREEREKQLRKYEKYLLGHARDKKYQIKVPHDLEQEFPKIEIVTDHEGVAHVIEQRQKQLQRIGEHLLKELNIRLLEKQI